VADATTYHESHLYATDWTDSDTDTQTIALIYATRLLDSMIEWTGAPTDASTQALRWPRTGMYDFDDNLVATDAIPTELANATAEFARQLIASNRAADNDVETQGLTGLTAGAVSLQFKAVTPKVIPDAVLHLLPASWGAQRRKTGTSSVVLERA